MNRSPTDTKAFMRTCSALQAACRYLSFNERGLLGTKPKEALTLRGRFSFSPAMVSELMDATGITDKSALLNAAQQIDDGDQYLSRDELLRAAHVVKNIVAPHDVQSLIERCEAVSTTMGAKVNRLEITGDVPILTITKAAAKLPRLRVFISGGVHGNEPCGSGAALLLLEQLQADPKLSEDIEWHILPLVNPRGMALASRRTPEDIDLNRVFVSERNDELAEVRVVRQFLKENRVDLALDLHSGKAHRSGFWLLHRNTKALATIAMARFAERWPVLRHNTKPYKMTTPGVAASSSTETLKDLATKKGARWSCTVEAPGSVSYLDQVLGENEIVHHMVDEALRTRASGDDEDSRQI